MKIQNKNIRKLTRTGRAGLSLCITLPADLIKELRWREKQKVVVKRVKGGLLIKDWRSKK